MSVTIKKIAEICGVSRGTVDRVLNNRGNVKKETEELVNKIALQLGYKPNIAGKALAAKKKSYNIGVILCSDGNAFFDDVIRGIKAAENDISCYGAKVTLKTMKGYNVEKQIDLIDQMKENINALIINPINDSKIAEKLNSLNIPVITVNTDLKNSRRLCYIGSDYTRGGETACGVMGILTGGKANVGIITGSIKILGHNQRVVGFKNIYKNKYPNFKIMDIRETNDDDIQAFEVTKAMLEEHPNINALFIVAAGVYGVCRAVISLGLDEKISIVSFDAVPTTCEMMRKGLIKATICQQPYTQGFRSVHIAFDHLISGQPPEKERFIVKNEIKILENL